MKRGAELLTLPSLRGKVSLPALMRELGQRGVTALLLEGGNGNHAAMLKANLGQHVRLYEASYHMKDVSPSHLLLDPNRLPRHVAIIMDGNGRWAQRRGLRRVRGHAAGAESVRAVVRLSRQVCIRHLTLYAFSEENWQRPKGEIRALMTLLMRYLRRELADLKEKNIASQAIGDLSRLPEDVQQELTRTSGATSQGDQMVLSVALSYGARSEIIQAVKALARDLLEGRLDLEDIDQTRFSR